MKIFGFSSLNIFILATTSFFSWMDNFLIFNPLTSHQWLNIMKRQNLNYSLDIDHL